MAILSFRPALAQERTLDNGVLVVGIDLARGGAINELRESGAPNSLVNIHDPGRYIQQSYYSFPIPFLPAGATMHPAYPNWGWNPVQAGDAYGNLSSVIEATNDGTTLYAKCTPKQWALFNVASGVYFFSLESLGRTQTIKVSLVQ